MFMCPRVGGMDEIDYVVGIQTTHEIAAADLKQGLGKIDLPDLQTLLRQPLRQSHIAWRQAITAGDPDDQIVTLCRIMMQVEVGAVMGGDVNFACRKRKLLLGETQRQLQNEQESDD